MAASHKPLPPVQTSPRAADAASYMAMVAANLQAQQVARMNQAIGMYTGFNPRTPYQSAPGPQHLSVTGETPGSMSVNQATNIIPYDVNLIRQYPNLSPSMQLAVRWSVAFKPSWTYQELQAYRQAVYDSSNQAKQFALDPRYTAPGVFHAYQPGEAAGQFDADPTVNVPPYNVDMIRRYPSLTPAEQLRVRYAVALKASWTTAELDAYRQAVYESDPRANQFTLDPRWSAPGVFHLGRVGEAAGAFYTPRQAADAFADLAKQMEAVAQQARRAGDVMVTMRTSLPRDIGIPSLDTPMATSFAQNPRRANQL